MGLNQHLRRSIYAIVQQGGVRVSDSEVIMPQPLLVGRSAAKLDAISKECGGLEWTTNLDKALADPAFRADVVERIAALHRIGEPMDVAGAVVFLASPAASLITGHTMLIDGGWTAR